MCRTYRLIIFITVSNGVMSVLEVYVPTWGLSKTLSLDVVEFTVWEDQDQVLTFLFGVQDVHSGFTQSNDSREQTRMHMSPHPKCVSCFGSTWSVTDTDLMLGINQKALWHHHRGKNQTENNVFPFSVFTVHKETLCLWKTHFYYRVLIHRHINRQVEKWKNRLQVLQKKT